MACVGPNKFIAKVASDLQKSNGLAVIPPQSAGRFLERLPIEKIWGVGLATANRHHKMGLHTVGDIRKSPVFSLEKGLGKLRAFIYGLSHGIDLCPVKHYLAPKSHGTETTFN